MTKKTYKRKTVKKPKGYDKAARNAIPLKDLLSGKSELGALGKLAGGINLGNLGKSMGGPGTHTPVKSSGAAIDTMADGGKIWLKGPNKGQMVK